MPIPCPTDEQIRHFAASGGDSPDNSDLIDHLVHCVPCQARLDACAPPAAHGPASPATDSGTRAGAPADPELARNILRAFRGSVQAAAENGDGAAEEVDGFRLVRLLGTGGMGEVYEALDTRLGRRIAVKTLRAASFTHETLARLKAEARALAGLQHPGIVRVFGWGERRGLPYLAMEFVEGETLSQRLKSGPLPPDHAARLLREAARAMQHAHTHGVLHRDLKPSNILLARPGVDAAGMPEDPALWAPKIIDFGLSKSLDGATGMTHAGVVVGTPAYMAPEQADNAPDQVGPRSDLYGLGAVLYHCLTGQPPFPTDSVANTLQMVRFAEPANPRFFNRRIPRDLETICLKCLRKDQASRYHTAAELADDLDSFLAGRPIQARPLGLVEKAWSWVGRNRRLAAALAGLALALLVLVGVLGVYGWREARLHRLAEDEAARANTLLVEALQGHLTGARSLLEVLFLLRAANERPLDSTTSSIRSSLRATSGKLLESFRRHPELAEKHPEWLAEILFARILLCRETGDRDGEAAASEELLEICARLPDPSPKLLSMEMDMVLFTGRQRLEAGRPRDALAVWDDFWHRRSGLPAKRLLADPTMTRWMESLATQLADNLASQNHDTQGADAVRKRWEELKAQGKGPG